MTIIPSNISIEINCIGRVGYLSFPITKWPIYIGTNFEFYINI